MLNTGSSVVVDVFLDLALLLARSWLIYGHFYHLIPVGHYSATKSRVLGVHLRLVHRPEPVEIEHFFVPLSGWLHITFWLISHTVINAD